MKYIVVLRVEVKEDSTGVFPNPEDVRARLRDVLMDVTKHDEMIDWRVTGVESLPQALSRELTF